MEVRALADAHPEWKFRLKPMRGFDIPKREFSFDFFQMGVDPKTLNYRPEDFFFCNVARTYLINRLQPVARPRHNCRAEGELV
jgi:hypothetical protein